MCIIKEIKKLNLYFISITHIFEESHFVRLIVLKILIVQLSIFIALLICNIFFVSTISNNNNNAISKPCWENDELIIIYLNSL